jgi:predicted nuclease of restriction endonuclease-like RecB superfamily
MQLNNKKEEIENECVLILDKMKSFFEKYNDDKDTDLTDEQIDNIFLNMNEDEKQQISELQNQFEILINKLNELDKIKIDDVEECVEDVAPKEDITKEYEDLENLKSSQIKFLCLIETMVSLYPERFKTV